MLLLAAGCEPSDRRPGMWLSGESAEAFPDDWSFTSAHREISLEVATPYLLAHSVTIWCAEVDGDLFVAASNPDEKRWPGWVDADPEVTLKVGERLFPARLEPLEDPALLARVTAAYQEKYQLPATSGGTSRYWAVVARGDA